MEHFLHPGRQLLKVLDAIVLSLVEDLSDANEARLGIEGFAVYVEQTVPCEQAEAFLNSTPIGLLSQALPVHPLSQHTSMHPYQT